MAEHTHSSLEQALSSDAYNAPGLSPIEFLRAVMEATHQPMSIRIEAAKGLLPYTNSVPRPVAPPAYTIVIPPLSLEPWSHIQQEITVKILFRLKYPSPATERPGTPKI